jgi:hypothetical protein
MTLPYSKCGVIYYKPNRSGLSPAFLMVKYPEATSAPPGVPRDQGFSIVIAPAVKLQVPRRPVRRATRRLQGPQQLGISNSRSLAKPSWRLTESPTSQLDAHSTSVCSALRANSLRLPRSLVPTRSRRRPSTGTCLSRAEHYSASSERKAKLPISGSVLMLLPYKSFRATGYARSRALSPRAKA